MPFHQLSGKWGEGIMTRKTLLRLYAVVKCDLGRILVFIRVKVQEIKNKKNKNKKL